MRVTTLLYHDVVESGEWDSSGFAGPGPRRYKLTVNDFEKHLTMIRRVANGHPLTIEEILCGNAKASPWLVTFDDGGCSAYHHIAQQLERYNWRGHFFITTDYIGKRGFLTARQIRALRRRGHVVGTHSCSHPMRMADCTSEQLQREWEESLSVLSDILGEQVRVGSVPGGYFSRRVAEAAATAGIKALFTSEPTRKCYEVQDCLVLGRYFLGNGSSDTIAASLASNRWYPRLKQYTVWNLKKAAKMIGGKHYVKLREFIVSLDRHS